MSGGGRDIADATTRAECYTILYYTILYYTKLYYTILYYTILYYTILYYTIGDACLHSRFISIKRNVESTSLSTDCNIRPVHLLRVFLLIVLESNFPGDSLYNCTDMRIPTFLK